MFDAIPTVFEPIHTMLEAVHAMFWASMRCLDPVHTMLQPVHALRRLGEMRVHPRKPASVVCFNPTRKSHISAGVGTYSSTSENPTIRDPVNGRPLDRQEGNGRRGE